MYARRRRSLADYAALIRPTWSHGVIHNAGAQCWARVEMVDLTPELI